MKLRRILKASGRSFYPFVNRHPFFSLLGVPLFVYVLVVMVFTAAETPQQRQEREAQAAQRQAQYAQQDVQQTERAEHLRVACRAKRACERWAQVRQECATAGNFDTCVNIKMEDKTAVLLDYCTNDGHMGDRSQEPSAVECLFY